MNADGYNDIIIGAWGANPYGKIYAGIIYVIFGYSSTTNYIMILI